jgi:hypothetical protein
MEKFRVEVAHLIRESITVDVESPDRETLDALRKEIHAQATILPGWEFDWDAGTCDEEVSIEEHAERYDLVPQGVFRVTDDGHLEVVEVNPRTSSGEKRSLKAKIEKALGRVESACLDDADDRRRVVTALLEELG